MKNRTVILGTLYSGVFALIAVPMLAFADKSGPDAGAAAESDVIEVQQTRAEIDAMARETLKELMDTNKVSRDIHEQSEGYAVFRATKAGLVVTGAGGTGVVMDKASGTPTYMRMGSGGVGLGAGLQSYRLVIFFETQAALKQFVDGGWDASTSAQAAAGKAGVNATSSFVDNIAVFQHTNKGLMAQADLTGTRFWKSESLNF